jgi:hypothetical protein
MIIYLYGPDSYRRQEKLNEYLERYKERYASGAGNFYLDNEGDWIRFKDFCQTQSLFDASRLGLVFNFSELDKKELKEFSVLVKNNLENKDLTLILNSDKKPTKGFSFLLEKTLPTGRQAIVFHEFEFLSGADLKKFLDLELKKRNIEMDSESRDLILLALGQDTWELIMELDKLALLDEKKINKKILERHIDLLPAIDVFSQLNKIRKSYDAGGRLLFLEEFFSGGIDLGMIFNMAAASPYLEKVQKIKMADYDVAIKSGKLEYAEVLTDMML